jgi:hypothetical protein
MIDPYPPVKFCIHLTDLFWCDVLWAIEYRIFGWKDVKTYALFCIEKSDQKSLDIEYAIADLEKNDASKIIDLARDAALRDRIEADGNQRDKWLFLLLAWIYSNREIFSNPLSVVEELYSEFDYPESIESFVGYLPAKDGWDSQAHSTAENEAQMMSKFQQFIENSKFRKSTK